MNLFLRTVVVIPITSAIKKYAWRVKCSISDRDGSIATDQIKVVDRAHIGSGISKLSKKEIIALKELLKKMLIE